MRAEGIRAEVLRRGRDVRRDQITAALERLESRGFVRQRTGAWYIVSLDKVTGAFTDEDEEP